MITEFNKQAYINNLDDIVSNIETGHLSVFIGAGVSTTSGFVDWKGLMRPIIEQLGVNPNIDLALAAQFYENKYHRHSINKLIYNEFNRPSKENNEVLELLGNLPISSYWTTNYDSLIEDTISKHKVVDVKIDKNSFKYQKPNCDVTLYKMHGDRNSPDTAVITKNDYETYDATREVFTKALSVELITNTFLFIGFSFSDPNLERILNIVKHTFDPKHEKKHYCFMRKVQESDYKTGDNSFNQDMSYQSLRVEEMRRYGIETILLDEFDQIELCLLYIQKCLCQKRIFISGSISKDLDIESNEAIFIQHLAKELTTNGYKIITGFGQNIGNYLLIGASAERDINEIRNLHNYIEVYPIVAKNEPADAESLRKALISSCGSIITLFGKNIDAFNDQSLSIDGVHYEYTIAKNQDKTLLPIGCTHYTSEYLWKVQSNNNHCFADDVVKEYWNNLENKSYCNDKEIIVSSLIKLIEYRNLKNKEDLKSKLLNNFVRKKVFLSFHYRTSHKFANIIRETINKTNVYIATEEEKLSNTSTSDTIKKWIEEKLFGTVATVLIYDDAVFDSPFVKYEIEQSKKRNNKFLIISQINNLEKVSESLTKNGLTPSNNVVLLKYEDVSSSQDMLYVLNRIITDDKLSFLNHT